MSDNVVPDLPDNRTPKTENEVMETNSPNGDTAPVAEIIIGGQPLMKVPNGPIVVKDATLAPTPATVVESKSKKTAAAIAATDSTAASQAAAQSTEANALVNGQETQGVSDEKKNKKTAPIQLSSAEQPKIAEEMEAIALGADIEATPFAEIDRRIRARSSRYSEKDFVCPKPNIHHDHHFLILS
ncbi:hypothetical protein GCK72_005226 [Caenorhabditis remanei]|uniref:Uncharacterized protein n=1 Tax=Caenorhabditis remanei TaxID=31234 RepID=A0A6A5HEM1_CAERE|nr:hypothetical protein GCK72_005226 [Caenorhabditis remanei]KAF1765274.1 hypothetical protein GCK72_005226 [Caenorhabditis remanei]